MTVRAEQSIQVAVEVHPTDTQISNVVVLIDGHSMPLCTVSAGIPQSDVQRLLDALVTSFRGYACSSVESTRTALTHPGLAEAVERMVRGGIPR